LKRAAADLADKLHTSCLSNDFDSKDLIIPLLVDMKMYKGSFSQLLTQSLPIGLPLNKILENYSVKILIDSFNEMPREYIENGTCESDMENLIKNSGSASIIWGSRTTDGLSKLGLPVYNLDQIARSTVEAELEKKGIKLKGRFLREAVSLLQRPFFFHYVISGKIVLPKEAHPRDFYSIFFQDIQKAFSIRFSTDFDIEKALAIAAYNTLNNGEEALLLVDLLGTLKSRLFPENRNLDVSAIANWLVFYSVLIPYPGGRIAFVHQSVTEYLAATELSQQYQSNPHLLHEKLRFRRWDQALYLTLSLLTDQKAETFLQEVINTDFELALNASKYLEIGRENIVSRLLEEIPSRIQQNKTENWELASAVRYGLSLDKSNLPALYKLIKLGNHIAGAAAEKIISLKGEIVKEEMLQMMFDCAEDYSLCTGIGRSLQRFLKNEDVPKILELCDRLGDRKDVKNDEDEKDEEDEIDSIFGFIKGAEEAMDLIETDILKEYFFSNGIEKLSKVKANLLSNLLSNKSETKALNILADLLACGYQDSIFPICMLLKYRNNENVLKYDIFNSLHIDKIITSINTNTLFEKDCLIEICKNRQDLAVYVKEIADEAGGIQNIILNYCVNPLNTEPIFEAFSILVASSGKSLETNTLMHFKGVKLDWAGKEDLFISLLKLRKPEILSSIFSGSLPTTINNLGVFKILDVLWWLDWIKELLSNERTNWLGEQLGSVLAIYCDLETRKLWLEEHNKSNSQFRILLQSNILPYLPDLTTDELSEASISATLANLTNSAIVPSFRGHILASIATEHFVSSRLLPLLKDAKEPLIGNLKDILKQASKRHGRRYLFE
jgi:hypothetical protein